MTGLCTSAMLPVHLQELLGHCTALYSSNFKGVQRLEAHLKQYGYQPGVLQQPADLLAAAAAHTAAGGCTSGMVQGRVMLPADHATTECTFAIHCSKPMCPCNMQTVQAMGLDQTGRMMTMMLCWGRAVSHYVGQLQAASKPPLPPIRCPWQLASA